MKKNDVQQELIFIRKVISDCRKVNSQSSVYFLLWGILCVIALSLDYLRYIGNIQLPPNCIWIAFFFIGWFFSILIYIRHRRKLGARTIGGTILGTVWLACGVVVSIVAFVLPRFHAINYWAVTPIIGLILGIGHYTSGVIQKDRWFLLAGLGWWIGSVIMVVWPSIYNFLIFGAMIILFQIVPSLHIKYAQNKDSEYQND